MLGLTTETGVAAIELQRPDRHNALDAELCRRLEEAVTEAARSARVVVITGAGRSFCAGADFGDLEAGGFREALYSALSAITAVPVPVIAAVNGPAIGAGTQLAIACDLRIADERARFGLPTARLGLAVDPWTIRRLALLAGGGGARFLLLGDGEIHRDQAYSLGLVDRLGALPDALAWAQELARLAPLTLAYNKRALEALLEPDPAPPELRALFDGCWASQDLREGLRARSEGRAPQFEGS
jgi:enoyl-CoA hydratase